MGEKKSAHRFVWGNLIDGYQLEDLGIDWRIILKWMCKGGMGKHVVD
jgi:hypothetical protein